RLAAQDLVVEHERALLEHLDRVLAAARAHEQLLERGERAKIGRIDRGHLAPRLDRVIDAIELAFELAELRVELDRLDLTELAHLDDATERLRQVVPCLRRTLMRCDGA